MLFFRLFLYYILWCHIFTGSFFAAGLYGNYLVLLKSSPAPKSPGGRVTVRELKSRAEQNMAGFTQRLGLVSSDNSNMNGPRRPASGSVRQIDQLWVANCVSVTVRHDFVSELALLPEVQTIIPDEPVFLSISSSNQSELSPSFQVLHEKGLDGRGIRIGVIDSGIIHHPDFTNAVRAYRDFTSQPSSDYTDLYGHGSHVSSILASRGLSGQLTGVAPAAELVIARVLEPIALDGSLQEGAQRMRAFASRLLAAMQWMLDPDENPDTDDYPQVVNNSWGFSVNTPLSMELFDRAIAAWRDLGIIPVFAAGNDGQRGDNSIYYPASSPHVIAVGALRGHERAYFSSTGGNLQEKPDFMMPGYGIWGLRSDQGNYGSMSGTSQAAPFLSGLIALLLQINPLADYDQVYLSLRLACTSDTPSWSKEYGWGMPDIERAVSSFYQHLQSRIQAGGSDTFAEYERLYLLHYDQGNREALKVLRELEQAYCRFIERELERETPSLILHRWLRDLAQRQESSPRPFRALAKLISERISYLSR